MSILSCRVRKGFRCHCGKSYKTAHALKNHSIQVHNTDNIQLTQVPVGTGSTAGSISLSTVGHNSNGSGSVAAANSSTVQLSPASSISSLSSSNGVSAANGVSPPANGSGLKSNFGLITIKSKNSNILATQKFVKLLTTQAQAQQAQAQQQSSPVAMAVDDSRLDLSGGGGGGGRATTNGLLQQSASASAVGGVAAATMATQATTNGGGGGSLPSLVNLDILTPATSPRNGTQGGGGGNSSSSSSNSSSSSGCSSMESLPLTPVSPTIGKAAAEAFVVGVATTQELLGSGVPLLGGDGAEDQHMAEDT